MGKQLGILGAAIAVAALVAGVTSPAAGAAGNAHASRTFSVAAVVTELKLVSMSTKGPSLGDEIVFAEKLLQGGKEVGHQGAVCTTVSLTRHEAQCIATYLFAGGQITAQAVIILGSMAPYTVPITGGSGKYEGVTGVVNVHPVSGTKGNLTFHLKS